MAPAPFAFSRLVKIIFNSMKTKPESRQWQMLLGAAELATVVFYAWKNVHQATREAENAQRAHAARVALQTASMPRPDRGSAAGPGTDTPQPTKEEMASGPVEAVSELAKEGGFSLKRLGSIAIAAAKSWSAHRAASKGAALALYTLFSLAPMLVLCIAVAGLFFGVDAVRELVMKQMGGLLGAQGAEAMKSILAGAHFESDSMMAALISTGLVLVGATSAFSELKDSLDELWEVKGHSEGGIWTMVRERFLSFGLVLVLALMLLLSLAVSTALAALGDVWIGGVENQWYLLFAKVVSSIVSFVIVVALFAAIYKYLPAAPIAWSDVVLGSVITAVLFLAGKYLIGLYLGTTNFSSGYGAAGSLVLLVSWIYYSAQIFFYGALFTHEHAVRSGRAIPTKKAADGAAPVASS